MPVIIPNIPFIPRRSVKRTPPPPLPAHVSVVSVSATESGDGIILFDSHVITDVSDVSQLEMQWEGGEWIPCDVIVGFDANSIELQNANIVSPGRAWRILSPMGVTWDDDPAVTMNVPASGVVL